MIALSLQLDSISVLLLYVLSLAPVGQAQGGLINLLSFVLQSEGENNDDILMNHLYSSGIHG